MNGLWSIYSSEVSKSNHQILTGLYICIRNWAGQCEEMQKRVQHCSSSKQGLLPMVSSLLGHGEFADKFWEDQKCSEIVGKILST